MSRTIRPLPGAAPLEAALTLLVEFAVQRQLPVVPGYFDSEDRGLPLVIFHDDTRGEMEAQPLDSMRQYLAALQPLEIALLVLWVDRLNRSDWEEAVDDRRAAVARRAGSPVGEGERARDGATEEPNALSAEELPAVPTGDQRRQLEGTLEEAVGLENRLGEIRSLQVRAVTRDPALMIEWWQSAPWSGLLTVAPEDASERAGITSSARNAESPDSPMA